MASSVHVTSGMTSFLAAAVLLLAIAVPASGQDGTFVGRGLQLHYRSIGSGTPIVILSGGPGLEVDYMLPVAQLFPRHRRILLEQRGTGRSSPPRVAAEDMTLSVAVADVEALRVHLGQERLLLAGHSWGGMLAMAYAAAYPDRVDRLILIDTGGPTLEFAPWFNDNIRARLRPEDVAAEKYWTDAAAHGVAPDKVALETMRAVTPAYFYDRERGLKFAASMPDGSVHDAEGTMLFADLQKSYDLRDGLRRLRRPVLIIHGHQDPMGDKTAEDVHALIAGSELVYLNQCGHFPWLEQPEAFAKALDAFMAR